MYQRARCFPLVLSTAALFPETAEYVMKNGCNGRCKRLAQVVFLVGRGACIFVQQIQGRTVTAQRVTQTRIRRIAFKHRDAHATIVAETA